MLEIRPLGLCAHWRSSPCVANKLARLKGTVEVDETYMGGKQYRGPRGRETHVKSNKSPVVALVERGGDMRSYHTEMVTGRTLKQVIRENVSPEAHIMTADSRAYRGLGKESGNTALSDTSGASMLTSEAMP